MKYIKKEPVEYVVNGNPQLLLVSGLHGDEYQVCDELRLYMNNDRKLGVGYVYVPVASPSAYQARGRLGIGGIDMNRCFLPSVQSEEKTNLTKVLKEFRCDMVIDFHEDEDNVDEFYLYEQGFFIDEHKWKKFVGDLSAIGMRLFTGVDDPNDENLRNTFVSGREVRMMKNEQEERHGFLSEWLIDNGICKRSLIVEFPGKAKLDLKRKLVEVCMKHFVSW